MITLKDVRFLAKKIGASVEDEKSGSYHTCRVEAPQGYVFEESDLHEFVDETNRPWKPDYEDMHARMSFGIKKCPFGIECEWCNPQD